MLTVLTFHNGDRPLALKLAEWICDLGGVQAHQLMLVLHHEIDPSGVVEPLQDAFGKVFLLRVPDRDPKSWPAGPNLMFRRAARQIEATAPQPWLWMETDAVPLRASWMDEIAAEYARCAPEKPFMGALVQLPGIVPHMSGIAVYPGKAPSLATGLVTSTKIAFDVNSRSQVLPKLTQTALIQHEWKPEPFLHADDLQRIRPEAAVYHQCKTGGLIDRLRERNGVTMPLLANDTVELTEEYADNLQAVVKQLHPEGAGNVVSGYVKSAGLLKKPRKTPGRLRKEAK